MPQVSIIIRTFNEQKHIWNLIQALRMQQERNFETILVDSGSTDATVKIAEGLCNKILHISSRDFTFGYSLNIGCREAAGEYLVFISAHAIPLDAYWLSRLLALLRKDPQVAMTYGRHIGATANKFSEKRDFERLFPARANEAQRPYPYYAINANSAIRKVLWQEHNFDENLAGLEDLAWGKHYAGKGLKVVYVPEAAVHHIHEEQWSQVYNRYRREAVAAKTIDLPYPPHGHPAVYFFVKNVTADLLAAFPRLSPSQVGEIAKYRYQQWRGTRDGWRREVNLDQERFNLFYSGANRAVMIDSVGQAQIKDVPVPEVKPSDVLIKVAYVGVCRTDLEVHDGVLGYYRDGLAKYPIVPGHEFSGEIVRLGANAQGTFSVGDHVVGECILSCGSCGHCVRGSHTACASRREVGVMNYNGAYAKFVALPGQAVHKIPDGLDLKAACLTEPLAVVLRALRRSEGRIQPGSTCAVIGAGPIGNLTAQVLSYLGYHVTVFNRSPHRLRFVGALSTSQTLERLSEFDVIVEASGNVEALEKVLAESRSDATIILLGFPYGNISYNFEDIVGREKVVIGSVGGASQDFERALELLPHLDAVPFTQMVLPLEKFSEAWDLHRSSQHLKILLQPSYESK